MKFELLETPISYKFAVSDVPDTRAPLGPRVTLRPEQVTIQLDGGPGTAIRHITIKGRTVRRDKTITGYREAGWVCSPHLLDPLPPDVINPLPPSWIVELAEAFELRWPEEWQRALDKLREEQEQRSGS